MREGQECARNISNQVDTSFLVATGSEAPVNVNAAKVNRPSNLVSGAGRASRKPSQLLMLYTPACLCSRGGKIWWTMDGRPQASQRSTWSTAFSVRPENLAIWERGVMALG